MSTTSNVTGGGMGFVRTTADGLSLCQLETKVKIRDERNRIQILTIGRENDKPTKTILLVGQTGAGKSTLLNTMINFLWQVKATDESRFFVRDETGDKEKSAFESQTEFVTGYLVYHRPGMPYECNFLIIDTPGLQDTRGEAEQARIQRQIEIFLRERKFEVDELHCLAFVVNGTINRSHSYVRRVVDDFENLFGKDALKVFTVMATHTNDKAPVSRVLEDLGISVDKMYSFDNGVFWQNVLGDSKKSHISRFMWHLLVDRYNEFFEELMISKPVSLQLTREAIAEKMKLERSLLMLKKHIEYRIQSLLESRSKRRMYENFVICMKANEDFEGEEIVKEKKKVKIANAFIHAHNCPKCNQTCVYPCSAIKSAFCMCPQGNTTCEFCPCIMADHEMESHQIVESLETRKVTHDSMKKKYDAFKEQKQSLEGVMKDLAAMAATQLRVIASYISSTVKHIERINEITMRPKLKTPEEYVRRIIDDIKGPLLQSLEDPSDKVFAMNTLNSMLGQVMNTIQVSENPENRKTLKTIICQRFCSLSFSDHHFCVGKNNLDPQISEGRLHQVNNLIRRCSKEEKRT